MVNSLRRTGGANVGWMNASWPLATLEVDRDALRLKVALVGAYSFAPSEVVSIQKTTLIPLLGWGIRIEHTRAEYPRKIIFWCLGRPDTLLTRIAETGFRPAARPEQIPARKGWPVRWQFLVATVLLWNLLLFADVGFPPERSREPGLFTFAALLLLFVGSMAVRRSGWLQGLVMKPGRDLEEIRPVVNLLSFVSGLMTFVFALSLLVRSFPG